MLIDTHTHINKDQFADDREQAIQRAHEAGIAWFVEIGIDLADSEAVLQLADKHAGIYCAIGVHPHDAKSWTAEHYARLKELAKHPKVVAIGEMGLDYHYDFSPREVQAQVFRAQINLAQELNLPIIIHDRDAHEDVMQILTEQDARNVLLHCFSGDLRMAEWGLARGYTIAFGGSLTFKKSDRPDILVKMPLDRVVLETDCPYLAPVPFRGKRNEPAYVAHVAQKMAEVCHRPLDEIAKITTDNAHRFYRLGSS